MNSFKGKIATAYSIKAEPTSTGFLISLLRPDRTLVPLSLEIISGISKEQLDEKSARIIASLIQNVGRFELNSQSTDLAPDIHDAFNASEIDVPLFSLEGGSIHLSNLCIASCRSGNLSEVANISFDALKLLGIPEYTPLKAKLQAHFGVENPQFGLDLDVMDLNGTPIRLTFVTGHIYKSDEEKIIFLSPYLHRLFERHKEHQLFRKTEKYQNDSQERFRELADLRKSAMNAEIRIDPFIKSQKIVFIKTLPYVLGRGPDDKVELNPALPIEHSELDRGFQALINASQDERPSHFNIQDEVSGTTRIVLSEDAWRDVQKIKHLQSGGQVALEKLMDDPIKVFGRKPRSAIASTFADRVSGFVIGKLTSNRSDSGSGNDWGDGYEGQSTLLRAADGSTIALSYAPTPPQYSAMKRACDELKESIADDELALRLESGALLTPVPIMKQSRVYIDALKGEFNLSELVTCCNRIEYSNKIELEPEEEPRARELIEVAEGSSALIVEWGTQEDGSARIVPLQSLKASLPQTASMKANDRVSLAIQDQATRLGSPPSWHYSRCDLSRFSNPPNFKKNFFLEPHQLKGIAWLTWIFEHVIDKEKYPHRGALLADDMGLGKTVQLLSFIASLRALPSYKQKPVLIVAPVSLIQSSWLEDGFNKFFDQESVLGFAEGSLGPILKFSDCPVKIDREILLSEALRVKEEMTESDKRLSDCEIDESLKGQLLEVNSWAQGKIIVTSYEALRINSLALGSIGFAAVILDEAQKIKNVGVLQSNSAKALKAEMCIAMTGTPIENSLMDLWSIMDFVLPGHLGSEEDFRKKFLSPVKKTLPGSIERAALKDQLENSLSPVWFRRTKSEVFKDDKRLPPIHHYDSIEDSNQTKVNSHEVQMSLSQFAIYETQLAYFKNAKPGHRLPVIRSMMEACAAPWIATDEPLRWSNREKIFELSPKLKITMGILEEIRARTDHAGRKTIIFANVIQIQDGLAFFIYEWNRLTGGEKLEIEVYNGEASPKLRSEMLSRFKKSPGFQVLIISPKAGGAGLNIVEANNVIHYTREWNPALERQATDRVYRMGQARPVHVYYPTTSLKHKEMVSAEERLANILSGKRDIMDDFTVSASDHSFSEGDLSGITTGTVQDRRIDPNGLHLLDPYSFECLVACLYEKQGFESHWCGRSGDGGADVIALKGDKAILVQVKHTQAQNPIGVGAIIQVRGAKSQYDSKLNRNFTLEAATNFKFSERAVQLTREGIPVALVEYSQLKDLLQKFTVMLTDIENKKSLGRFKI